MRRTNNLKSGGIALERKGRKLWKEDEDWSKETEDGTDENDSRCPQLDLAQDVIEEN